MNAAAPAGELRPGRDRAEAGDLPAGWRLEIHEILPSTADLLRERAAGGEPAGLAILARRQTAGRGRAGRPWASPPGNLALSVLLRPAGPAMEAGQWALLAGVALAEAAAETDPDPAALRLKWPNDLLRHGAKVAGILSEAELGPGRGLAWVSLGLGANLAVAPALPDRPTATLVRAGTAEGFATRLLRRLDHWCGVQARHGFAPVRAAWCELGPGPGAPLAVRLGTAELAGRFAGLGPDGGLLLDTAEGRRHILAGEVVGPAGLPHQVTG